MSNTGSENKCEERVTNIPGLRKARNGVIWFIFAVLHFLIFQTQ